MSRSPVPFHAVSLALVAQALLGAGGKADFAPIAGWDNQLYPSYLIATAAMRPTDESGDGDEDAEGSERLGDSRGVLGVRVESPGEDVPVTVTIESESILEPSTYCCNLPSEGTVYEVFPRIRYRYAALAKNKQSVPVTVTFRVELGDEEAEERSETVTLRSVNDCPYAVYHEDGSFTDVSYVFAAYVNEQHPFVDKVLREALDRGIVDSFTGYQSGEPAEVYRQVYALWDALSARDVRYSNITASAAENKVISSQHIRLIDESINNSQANCVDGSVLLASLLRKIDIEPVLVFIPGHCYLAFYLDAEGTRLVGLETTLIGSEAEGTSADFDGLNDVVDDAVRNTNSWRTFCAALAMGTADLEENEDKFNKDDTDYQTISIAAARKMGILPIAFDSNERFQESEADEE